MLRSHLTAVYITMVISCGMHPELFAANSPPVANNGSLTTSQNTSGSGFLSASDADGDPLTYSILSGPSHGTVTLSNSSSGSYTYTPASGFNGSDAFTFDATDSIFNSNVATISVTVTGGVVNSPPVASDGTLSTAMNGSASSTLSATDPDNDSLVFSIVGSPASGSVVITNSSLGTFSYTPQSGFSGNDHFTFKANDGVLDSNTATTTVIVGGSSNHQPVATSGSVSTRTSTSVNGSLQATDGDADQLTYIIVTNPNHGSVGLTNSLTGAYIYTPTSAYVGSDSFTFKVNDGVIDSNIATINVTVSVNGPIGSQGGGGNGGSVSGSGSCGAGGGAGAAASILMLSCGFLRRAGGARSTQGKSVG